MAAFILAALMIPSLASAEEIYVPEQADSRMIYHLNNNLSLDRYTRRLEQSGSTLRRNFSLSRQKRNQAVAEALAAKNSSSSSFSNASTAVSRNTTARTASETDFLIGDNDMPVRNYHLNRCNSRFHSRHFGTTNGFYSFCR